MKFYKKQIEDENLHVIFVEDDLRSIFHLSSPVDSIEYWQVGFLKMFDLSNCYKSQVEKLLKCCCQLGLPDPPEWEAQGLTFLKVICGLTRAIDILNIRKAKKRDKYKFIESSKLVDLQKRIKKLLAENQILNFKILYNKNEKLIEGRFFIREYKYPFVLKKGKLDYISEEWWNFLIKKKILKNKESFPLILEDFDLLEEIIMSQERIKNLVGDHHDTLLHSFGCFSEALLRFLDNDPSGDYIKYRAYVIPRLCAVIVKDEFFDFEEQKGYLERILKSRDLSESEKLKILEEIVIDLQEDYKRACKGD